MIRCGSKLGVTRLWSGSPCCGQWPRTRGDIGGSVFVHRFCVNPENGFSGCINKPHVDEGFDPGDELLCHGDSYQHWAIILRLNVRSERSSGPRF